MDDAAILRAVVAGTAGGTGTEFFQSLVQHLAVAMDAAYAFVAEFLPAANRVRTLAYWAKDRIAANVEFDLAGTPCEDVVRGAMCHHPRHVRSMFPQDTALVEMGIESYLGIPLMNRDGRVLGHLAIFDECDMPDDPQRADVFRIFAARACAELERLRMEALLRDSEQQFRDLFEEAPIAYVYEDTETRFVKANRAAMKLLGLQPEDVPGTVGMSLVAPNQVAQSSVQGAFDDIRQGMARELRELELRRKDNGQPVWVQFWSRPEPDGLHTRTMIIDITARVLAEQEKHRLHQQNQYLQEEIKAAHNFDEIINGATTLHKALRQVEQVAKTDSTVLILGETGTGKELIARAIHSRSRRHDRPLIKLNCAALPTGLVESELFGHEKGAFTGALERRIGRFHLAHGGTIFLDEIGDMPLEVQVKLLRVLQEQEFEPVGAAKSIRVDVRVIAATNRDLVQAVADSTFRADLYYRLNVFPIGLPPLRDRVSDIPLLVHYFVTKYSVKIGRSIERISPATLELLTKYSWPGNVRELENVIERAVILANGPVLEVDPDTLRIDPPSSAPVQRAASSVERSSTLAASERQHIIGALEQTAWVIEGPRGAAQVLGLHPNTLRSRMKKLRIQRPV